MAEGQRLSALGYLLDLVRIEAEEQANPQEREKQNAIS